MNCQQIRQEIASKPNAALTNDWVEHISTCELCHHWYSDFTLDKALLAFDVPELEDAFINRVMAKANQKPKRRFLAATRLAVAASIAIFSLALGLFLGQERTATFEVAIAPYEDRLVEVVINAAQAREQASLTILLAESLELSGYPGQRELQWNTDLAKGKNMLSLPIRLLGEGDTYFMVRMVHGTTEQSMRVDVLAKSPRIESVSA